jgi:hypothetical protein
VLDEMARRPLDVPDPIHPEHRERAALAFLMDRAAHVVGAEASVVREQLRRNGVGVLFGDGSIVDPHTVRVKDLEHDQSYTSENIVLAVGPSRRAQGRRVRRQDDHRLRRPAAPPAQAADEHDRRRRRRDRRRVRVDARGARPKVRWSTSARACCRSSTERSARRFSTYCAART